MVPFSRRIVGEFSITIYNISHNKKITVKELAEILEVSERHVKRYISYLRENGFLDRTKNNRYGEWIIKK